ncbi:MAG: DUF4365 domain-containing protein [Cyclobacteriaceae bacterium]
MEYPNRHTNHVLEELSERFFKNLVPPSWVVNHFWVDYGTDLNCEIERGGGMTGINFTVQLKGKQIDSGKEKVSVNKIKRTTVNRWLTRLEPTMLVIYVDDEKEAYWIWVEDNTFDLTDKKEFYSVSISRKNKLSKIAWGKVEDKLFKIFSNRHRLYELPEIDEENDIAWGYYFNRNFRKAIPYLKQILNRNPFDSLAMEALAICHYDLFSYEHALSFIDKALSIKVTDTTLLNKASILTEFGNSTGTNEMIEHAVRIYESMISERAQSYDIFYNLGSAYNALNDYQRAVDNLSIAAKLNPNKAEIWNNLGITYMYLGEQNGIIWEHENSMICFDRALTLNPNLAEALFTKGSSLFKHFRRIDEGLELMLKAVEISNRHEFDNPYVFFWISEAFFAKSNLNEAKKWNKEGLTYFPKDSFLSNQRNRLNE